MARLGTGRELVLRYQRMFRASESESSRVSNLSAAADILPFAMASVAASDTESEGGAALQHMSVGCARCGGGGGHVMSVTVLALALGRF